MMAAIDAEERQLEVVGPRWRPPSTVDVLRSLPFFHHLQEEEIGALLRGKVKLHTYKNQATVAPKGRWCCQQGCLGS
jgi:hypothetical protein